MAPKSRQGAGVIGENVALLIQQHKALGHVLGEGGKFLLTLAELVHLAPDGVILPPDPCQQRGELVIGIALLRVLQIQVQNRPDDPLGQPVASTAARIRDRTRMISRGWTMDTSRTTTVYWALARRDDGARPPAAGLHKMSFPTGWPTGAGPSPGNHSSPHGSPPGSA